MNHWISQCKSTYIYPYRYYIVNLNFYISLSLGGNGIGIGPAIFWYWISYIDIKPTMLVLDQLFIGIGPAAIYRRGNRQNGGGLKEAATYFSSLIWSCSENDVGLSSESESLFQWKWKFIQVKVKVYSSERCESKSAAIHMSGQVWSPNWRRQ